MCQSWRESKQCVRLQDVLNAALQTHLPTTTGVTAKGAHSNCATSLGPTPASFEKKVYVYHQISRTKMTSMYGAFLSSDCDGLTTGYTRNRWQKTRWIIQSVSGLGPL